MNLEQLNIIQQKKYWNQFLLRLNWHSFAKCDLIQIYNYSYEDSVYYAVKTTNEIVRKTDNLDFSPYMGRKVPEYDLIHVRELIYKSYRIIYEVQTNKILIRRIWHSARNLPKQLISQKLIQN